MSDDTKYLTPSEDTVLQYSTKDVCSAVLQQERGTFHKITQAINVRRRNREPMLQFQEKNIPGYANHSLLRHVGSTKVKYKYRIKAYKNNIWA